MSESYLKQKAEEGWSIEEINNYDMHVPDILDNFYFHARRGLTRGMPTFETRFPEGRMRALIEGIGVRNITIGVDYNYLTNIKNKGKLLKFLEERTLSAHSRRVIDLNKYGGQGMEQKNISKEFRKTQERNVKQFWNRGKSKV